MNEFAGAHESENKQSAVKENQYLKWLHEKASSDVLKEGLNVPMGLGADGIFSYDFKDIPHLLISGSPGSGKTTFVESIIAELMESNTPDNVQFLLFNSRGSDYKYIEPNPFFIKQPTDDPSVLRYFMQWIINKGTERLSSSNNHSGGGFSPDYFIIIDDCATVIKNKWAIEMLSNILINGRVANIHLILVTSTSDRTSMPTKIRDAIPCRIAFNVASRSASRTILNMAGAENLSIPGEMYFKAPNVLEKIQAVYLPQDDLNSVMYRIIVDYVSIQTLGKLGAISAGIMGRPIPVNKSCLSSQLPEKHMKEPSFSKTSTPNSIIPVNETKDTSSTSETEEKSTDISSTFDKMHEIPLTPQPKITGNDFFVKVTNNELVIGKRLIDTTSINIYIRGKHLKDLKHHQASFLREGYISIIVPKWESNNKSGQMYGGQSINEVSKKLYENEMETGIIKIPYGFSKERHFYSFLRILSKDTGINIVEE